MGADNHAGKIQYRYPLNAKGNAYLLGVYMGDGCCNKDGYHYCLSVISEDRDVIEKTRSVVNLLLNKNYPLKCLMPNSTLLYRFRSYNRWLFEILIELTVNKSRIPESVFSSKREAISEFVAGLMDTDGYISTGINKSGYQRFALGFVNSGKWLDQFISLIASIGVKVGKKTLKKKYRSKSELDCFQVNINLRSFVEAGLYFSCKRKQQILERYKSSVRYQSY